MSVSCELCCVGSGFRLFTHSEESYCVFVCVSNCCDLESSVTREPRPNYGCCVTEKIMTHEDYKL